VQMLTEDWSLWKVCLGGDAVRQQHLTLYVSDLIAPKENQSFKQAID
jgi:hypothetical protein